MIDIPRPRKRRALIVVDIVPTFLTHRTRSVIPHVASLLGEGEYSYVIVAEHAKGRLHPRALENRTSRARSDETVPELAALLDPQRALLIAKDTRSAFDDTLAASLRRRRISDVHITGIETHDCVLATALDAFDCGFVTCVIERATASKRYLDYRAGLRILRRLHLTDHTLSI